MAVRGQSRFQHWFAGIAQPKSSFPKLRMEMDGDMQGGAELNAWLNENLWLIINHWPTSSPK